MANVVITTAFNKIHLKLINYIFLMFSKIFALTQCKLEKAKLQRRILESIRYCASQPVKEGEQALDGMRTAFTALKGVGHC